MTQTNDKNYKLFAKGINMVCADHSVLSVANYWLPRAGNHQNSNTFDVQKKS